MAEIRLRGLVLRETDFGDCDRYLSLLTEDGRRTEILHRPAGNTPLPRSSSAFPNLS